MKYCEKCFANLCLMGDTCNVCGIKYTDMVTKKEKELREVESQVFTKKNSFVKKKVQDMVSTILSFNYNSKIKYFKTVVSVIDNESKPHEGNSFVFNYKNNKILLNYYSGEYRVYFNGEQVANYSRDYQEDEKQTKVTDIRCFIDNGWVELLKELCERILRDKDKVIQAMVDFDNESNEEKIQELKKSYGV